MNINKQMVEDTLTLSFEGWLDTTTAPELGELLDTLDDNISNLIFDFEKLEYISSAGLRQVIIAYRKMGNENFKIINTSVQVMEVFKMTGFAEKMDIQ